MVTYTLLRLVLFLVPFGLLLAVGVAPIWAMLIGFVVSSLISIFALNRQRDQVSVSLVRRRERIRASMAERTASEDAWDEAQRAEAAGGAADEALPGSEPPRTGPSAAGELGDT
jgi:hypothetical protein